MVSRGRMREKVTREREEAEGLREGGMRLSGSRSAQTDAAQRRWSGGRGGDEGARGGWGGATYASEAEVGGLNYEREYNICDCCCIKPPVR